MAKTAYHVFRETDNREGSKAYEPLNANIQAHSAADAIRQTVKENGVYVALPARSFKTVTVTIATTTVVQLK